MAGAVVDDQEDTLRAAVGWLQHQLLDESGEGLDPALLLAAADQARLVDVERSQVGERTAPLVLVLDERGPFRPGRNRRVEALAGLDRGLLVGAEHVLAWAERLAVEDASVEVEHDARLLGKERVAREDPAAIAPGPDRVLVQPAPDRRARDRLDDATLDDEPAEIRA